MNILDVIGTWFLALLVFVNFRSLLVPWKYVISKCRHANWRRIGKVLFNVIYGALIISGMVWAWSWGDVSFHLPSWEALWKVALIGALYAAIWIGAFRKEAQKRWSYTHSNTYSTLDNLAVAFCIYAVIILVIYIVRL